MDGKLTDLALGGPRQRPKTLERYGLALALSGAALLTRGALPVPEGTTIYQLPLAVVVLSGWFGGRGPGLLALVVSATGILYWFIPPSDSFELPPDYMLAFAIFIGLGWLLVEFSGSRRAVQQALQVSEERFLALVQFSFDVYWETDASHRFTRQEFSERLTDAPTRGSEIGKTRWEIPYVEPDEEAWRQHRATLDAHLPFRDFELARPNADGSTRYVSVSGIPAFDEAGRFAGYRGVGRHITEQKRAEAEHRAHLWFLESMDRINRAMQATNDVEPMMSDVLDAVLEIFACDRAWLLYPCDPEAPSWRAVMEHTRPQFPGAFALHAELPLEPEVAAVFAAALASSGALCFGGTGQRELPPAAAERFAVRSQLAMALQPKGDRPYLFGLHQCSRPRSWTKDEQRLFEEIGHRLTDALSSLIALRSVRESETRLERAQRLARVGWWEHDLRTDQVSMSDETRRIFGVEPADLATWNERWLSLIHPDDRNRAVEALKVAVRSGTGHDVEFRVLRSDGTLRVARSLAGVSRDETGRAVRQFGVTQDITELRHAEAELSEIQERFRLVAELSLTGIYIEDGRHFSYVNPALAKMFGYTVAEIVDRLPARDLVCPEDRPLVAENMRKRLDGEVDELRYELRGLRKDGSVFPIEVHGRRINYRGKTAVLGTLVDYTERKRAEDQLRESEARFRMLVDHATDAFYLHDDQLRLVDANRQACESLGYSRDELIGMPLSAFIVDLDKTMILLRLPERIRAGEIVTFETLQRRKDASVYPVEIRVRGFRQGDRFLRLSLVRDITERRRAEEALRQSEAYLAEAQRLSHTGSWALDVATNKYIYTSAEFDRMYGFDTRAQPLTREVVVERIHPEDRSSWKHTLEKSLRENVDTSHEYRIVLPDGNVRHVQVIRHPVLNDAGEVVQLMGTSIDITERKLVEETLRSKDDALHAARSELARVSRLTTLGELTASIAHEVSQPLAAMTASAGACARWLAADPPGMAEARTALGNIVADAKRAREVISRIRALAKRQDARKDRLDVNHKVAEVLALTAQELRSHDIVVRTRLDATLPSVTGDRVQLQQVLLNLIVNAIDAMSGIDDRPRELTIVSRRDGDKAVVVEVRDAGAGLGPGSAEHVFEAFYTTKTEGLGIGLSISRSIVEAHGGRLWASSNEPHGAVFRFSLPVAEDE